MVLRLSTGRPQLDTCLMTSSSRILLIKWEMLKAVLMAKVIHAFILPESSHADTLTPLPGRKQGLYMPWRHLLRARDVPVVCTATPETVLLGISGWPPPS